MIRLLEINIKSSCQRLQVAISIVLSAIDNVTKIIKRQQKIESTSAKAVIKSKVLEESDIKTVKQILQDAMILLMKMKSNKIRKMINGKSGVLIKAEKRCLRTIGILMKFRKVQTNCIERNLLRYGTSLEIKFVCITAQTMYLLNISLQTLILQTRKKCLKKYCTY